MMDLFAIAWDSIVWDERGDKVGGGTPDNKTVANFIKEKGYSNVYIISENYRYRAYQYPEIRARASLKTAL